MDSFHSHDFSNKHVALFVPTMRGGGAEKAMLNLARGFVSLGLRVDLILLEKDGPYLDLIPPDVRIIDLADPSESIGSIRPLQKYFRQERPDVLIAALKQACMIALLAKMLGSRDMHLIATIHGNLPAPEKVMLRRLGRAIIYQWADEIVAVSDGVANDFAYNSGLSRQRVKTIYNGISSVELENKALLPVDHVWFETTDLPVLLSAGRLKKREGFRNHDTGICTTEKNSLYPVSNSRRGA